MQRGDVHLLVFTDVLYEDADLYRFLIEAAADVLDRRLNWSPPAAADFPDYRVAADTPIEAYAGNPDWRAFLADLRARAADALPELVWLVEGRDPWEVFRDERFLGNSSVDPCSKIGKRRKLDRWRRANCTPASSRFYVGIGSDEAHRFDDGAGGGIRPRMAKEGWDYRAPLIADTPENALSAVWWTRQQGLLPPGSTASTTSTTTAAGSAARPGTPTTATASTGSPSGSPTTA